MAVGRRPQLLGPWAPQQAADQRARGPPEGGPPAVTFPGEHWVDASAHCVLRARHWATGGTTEGPNTQGPLGHLGGHQL